MAEFRLETARLILRDRREADRAPFWASMCDDEVMRYLPRSTRADADARFDRQIAVQAEHGHCFWAIERKADGAMIGLCGIMVPRPPLAEYEIGWRLVRAAWGQGYAGEAARASLAWAWAHLATDTIVAITVPANTASRRLMTRLGMTHDPAEDFDHPDYAAGDRLRRHVLYRLRRPTGQEPRP